MVFTSIIVTVQRSLFPSPFKDAFKISHVIVCKENYINLSRGAPDFLIAWCLCALRKNPVEFCSRVKGVFF